MTKDIYSVVPDLYDLLAQKNGPHKVDRENLQVYLDKVMNLLLEKLEKPRESKPAGGNLRMSKIGLHPRKIWMESHTPGYDGEEGHDGQSLFKFLVGDIMEDLILFLVQESGHVVARQQEDTTLDGVNGHPDCTIDGRLVDVKTSTPYTFDKFAKGEILQPWADEYGYLGQLAGYRKAMGLEHTLPLFLAFNKSSAELALLEVPEQFLPDPSKLISEARKAATSDVCPPDLCFPPSADGKSGNMKIASPCSYCVDPDVKILTPDLRWVRASDLREGDDVLGFTEENVGQYRRMYKVGKVVACPALLLPKLEVITDKGSIKVSSDHQFLISRVIGAANRVVWMKASDLLPGDRIRRINTWEKATDYLSGWFSGILDGEGCLSSGILSFAQNKGLVLGKSLKYLEDNNYDRLKRYVKNGKGCIGVRIAGSFDDTLRLLGTIRPVRLLSKLREQIEGRSITTRYDGYASVIVVNKINKGAVIALETTCKTYIADGFFSHNCAFKWKCYPGLRAFSYSNGTRFLSQVVKTPDVEEITDRLKAYSKV